MRLKRISSKFLFILSCLIMFIFPNLVLTSNGDSSGSLLPAEWIMLNPDYSPNVPLGRRGHCMAYDGHNNIILMIGGFSHELGRRFDDTWAFDYTTNSWINMNPQIHPPHKEAANLVYDEVNQKFILFGGHTAWSGYYHDDTWSYDYNFNTWANLNPTIHPTPRWQHGMVYMKKHNKIFLFGGHSDYEGFLSDTWIYDTATNVWTKIITPDCPSPRVVSSMLVYEENYDIVFLYGGVDQTGEIADTWYFDPQSNTWHKIEDFAPPGPAYNYDYMTYDIESELIILLKGKSPESETWVYDFSSNLWLKLDVTSPSLRNQADAEYNSKDDVMILFGGAYKTLHFVNETWAFKLSPIEVDIDIKPGSYPNSINLGSNGNIPVAIFSADTFDAITVDPLTVTLAGAEVKMKGKGTAMSSIEDVNGDGLLDLIVHVDTTALVLSSADTEAVLEGQLYEIYGCTKIRGIDMVRIVQE